MTLAVAWKESAFSRREAGSSEGAPGTSEEEAGAFSGEETAPTAKFTICDFIKDYKIKGGGGMITWANIIG